MITSTYYLVKSEMSGAVYTMPTSESSDIDNTNIVTPTVTACPKIRPTI